MSRWVPLFLVSLALSGCGLINAFGFDDVGEGEGENECAESADDSDTISPGGVAAFFGSHDGECVARMPGAGCGAPRSDANPFETFEIISTDFQSITVRAVWSGFDGYLGVFESFFDPFDPEFNCVAINDDDEGTGTSRVVFDADPGDFFIIVASTFSDDEGGDFTIEVTSSP